MGWKVPEPREINNAGDCGDEYRRTFLRSQVGIRSESDFVVRVEQDLIDFRF